MVEGITARFFVAYNQNAKDRTVASAYSVSPTPDGPRSSTPLKLDEVADCRRSHSPSQTVPDFRPAGYPGGGLTTRWLAGRLLTWPGSEAAWLAGRPMAAAL